MRSNLHDADDLITQMYGSYSGNSSDSDSDLPTAIRSKRISGNYGGMREESKQLESLMFSQAENNWRPRTENTQGDLVTPKGVTSLASTIRLKQKSKLQAPKVGMGIIKEQM